MQERRFIYKITRDLQKNLIQGKENPESPLLQTGAFIHNINEWGKLMTLDRRSIDVYFTEEEQIHCGDRLESYAGRFAAKMAILQAMGGYDLDEFDQHEISIGSLSSGQPMAGVTGKVRELVADRNIAISISHDADIAIAMAVLIPQDFALIGIGLDIASNDRIYKALIRHGDRFMKRQFTKREAKESGGDVTKIAQRWAGKEAAAKALGTGFWNERVAWTDIEIVVDEAGKNTINLSGGALEKARTLGCRDWKIHLHEEDKVQIAFTIAY